ncbi:MULTISPECIES: flippase [unclassified Blautia]|uniref:flippase n=1 Tax=unclassified Blautia TaxID=2648079 RepID=UPI003F8BB7A2
MFRGEEKHMKNKSIKLNVFMNMLLTMSSFIFPLITFPYVSRILLPEGTGKVSFATSMISYFTMFAQLGIPTYGIRVCAKIRDNREELTRTAHELLFINLIMSLISYAVLGIALLTVPRLQEERTLYVVVSFTIILTSIGMEWLYKALEQYFYITIRSIIFKVVSLIAMFLLVHTKDDYVIYGGITILASSASNILNFINVHKYIDMKSVGNYNVKRHIKPVAIFFAMSCAATIYTNLDTVMLGFMDSDADVGYYNAAVRIKTILVSIVTSLGAVLLPRASYYIEHDKMDEFKRITEKALNFVFLFASPMILYFIFYAKEGIYFLSGKAYEGSIVPMQIIMPTLLFIGITNILGIQILVPLGREKTVLYSEIAGAIVDVIINALLIPKYASAGAAIGTLAAEFVVFVVQYTALKNEVTDAFKLIHYGKILIGLILGSVASLWVKTLGLGSFITLLISAMLFFGIYGLFLLITKEELVMEIFNQVIGKILKKVGKKNV